MLLYPYLSNLIRTRFGLSGRRPTNMTTPDKGSFYYWSTLIFHSRRNRYIYIGYCLVQYACPLPIVMLFEGISQCNRMSTIGKPTTRWWGPNIYSKKQDPHELVILIFHFLICLLADVWWHCYCLVVRFDGFVSLAHSLVLYQWLNIYIRLHIGWLFHPRECIWPVCHWVPH